MTRGRAKVAPRIRRETRAVLARRWAGWPAQRATACLWPRPSQQRRVAVDRRRRGRRRTGFPHEERFPGPGRAGPARGSRFRRGPRPLVPALAPSRATATALARASTGRTRAGLRGADGLQRCKTWMPRKETCSTTFPVALLDYCSLQNTTRVTRPWYLKLYTPLANFFFKFNKLK